MNNEEAVLVKRKLSAISKRSGQGSEVLNYLVIAGNEQLLGKMDIEKAYARIKDPEKVLREPTRRSLVIISMPFQLNILCQPEIFRNFQQLLFNTRVYFDSSFEANLWAPDERGIHARTPRLRAELKMLSNMHNKFVEALKQFHMGDASKGSAIVRTAFQLNERIVQIHHHRLFPDLLGILLLIQQRGHAEAPGLDALLRTELFLSARSFLPENDPRRLFFEFIMRVPSESIRHLYLVFDVHCREIWKSMTKDNEIESYYSYNQASFPRADRGDFYSLFEKKTVQEICGILSTADSRFGVYSSETFCLWHTALQYLFITERYDDMSSASKTICVRLEQFKDRWD